MSRGRVMRWIARWLDRRGLGAVADVVDARVAGAGDVEAMHALARRALSRGEAEAAILQLETALAARPEDAGLWCSLGAAYRHADNLDEAREAYLRALALKPDYPQALSNLGEWCIAKGQHEEALVWFDRALACKPGFFEARLNRIAALFELARFDEARAAAEALVADEPDRPEAHLNLGNVLIQTGRAKQGIAQYRRALELRPDYPEAHFNLATLLGSREEMANAIGYIERQIKERGETIQALGFLAAAHQAAGHLSQSEELCRRILARQPESIIALVTLGSCLSSGGDSAAALPLYEKVIELDGQQPGMYSNVLFELNNQSRIAPEAVFQRHLDWARRFELPLRAPDDFAARDRDPQRKLRIGYVSGDFVRHPVGFLLRDVLRHHDGTLFEIHCFSMVVREQDVLPELRQAAEHWEDIFFHSDEELADLIRKAEIDILVDLSGHTAFHRLLVFARRPAPVQAEWIGYFHSTGLSAIDYFITDPFTTPPGGGQLFSETPAFLPHTRFCYGPPEYAPEVAAPPLEKSGSITFGSFNRLPKMTDEVVSAWARILQSVAQSRLVVKSGALSEEAVKDRLAERFAAQGIGRDRLDLREVSAHGQMFAEYGDIDIALDTFPFNGGMTTLEALWMGVPVVTIAGDSVVSRQTTSALTNIGLTELIFADVDAYVAGAVSLAGDPGRLRKLRRGLRGRMKDSPLCQPEQFTRDLELLYRRMWRAWCEGEKLDGGIHAAPAIASKTVLHVGCGRADRRSMPRLFQSRWREIRLDIDPDAMPDVVASMLDMSSVESASVDAVYSSHTIEHLHPHEVPVALKEFRRVLKPEGMLVLTCPDLQPICALVAADELEEPAYVSPAGPIAPIDMLYGHRASLAKGNLYMAHKTGFTARSLARELEEGGFRAMVVEQGASFDLWALAYPEAPTQERIESERNACFPLVSKATGSAP